MEWVQGITQCWALSANCRIDWNAWGAIITFLAVLVPAMQHERERRENRLRIAELETRDKERVRQVAVQMLRRFVLDLVVLEAEVAAIRDTQPRIESLLMEKGRKALAQFLSLRSVVFPKLEPTREFEHLSHWLVALDIALTSYAQFVDSFTTGTSFDSSPGTLPKVVDQFITQIEHCTDEAKSAMEALIPGITADMP